MRKRKLSHYYVLLVKTTDLMNKENIEDRYVKNFKNSRGDILTGVELYEKYILRFESVIDAVKHIKNNYNNLVLYIYTGHSRRFSRKLYIARCDSDRVIDFHEVSFENGEVIVWVAKSIYLT